MQAMTLVIIAALVLVLAYRLYGAFIATRVLVLEASRLTPAHTKEDGSDYSPTNRWFVFGHHFAAIAGAGPLIGPVLAAQFGYLPGFLWILIGAVTAGAVHDMVVLFASVRYEGRSLAEIARQELGGATGWVASLTILMLLIIVLAGTSISVVNALYNSPWGTFTVAATVPVAILIGIYMRWIRPGKTVEATAIGVALMLLAVWGGSWIAGSSLASWFTLTREQLSLVIPAYGFIAAILPMGLLLVPRDYLSSYMKIGTILLLAAGIIAVNPVLQMPAFTDFVSGGGPVVPGKVWPFMFITVACGAISGWHSLVASGTSPKMINNEKDILPIGYGAMLVESFVAVMALIAATALAPGDYFAINSSPEVFAALNIPVQDLEAISLAVSENVAGRPGGAVSLAVGMAHIFSGIGGLQHLMGFWYHFAIMFEALFILTLVDAGTRVGRYLVQEIAGQFYAPMGNTNWWPGILLSSAVVTGAFGYLLYGGTIATIWPLFGVNNQLLASMALALGTTFIIRSGRLRYAWVTALPMVFLLVTAVSACYQNIFYAYLPGGKYLLAGVSVLLLIMIGIVIVRSILVWWELIQNRGEAAGKSRQWA